MVLSKNAVTYVIAEIGINHNGSFDNCLKLIDAAVDAGCSAVKFQFFKAKHLYPHSAGKLDWQDNGRRYSYDIYSATQRFELPEKWIKKLMLYCKSNSIDFLISVSDIQGLDLLVSYGLKQIKIPSYSVTNILLIEQAAAYKLPIILSTGGATLGEVEDAVRSVNKFHNKLSLLHCSIKYPTQLSECNLGVIKTLQYAFPGFAIGYSDHTKEISCAAVQAVYLGARIIEKHITLDKRMSGPDHFFALIPIELKKMVKDVRDAQADMKRGSFTINKRIYGETVKITYVHERYLRNFAFMKLFAKRYIKRGSRIKPSDILILRPAKKTGGIEPKYLKLFKDNVITAKSNISSEGPITWSDILS